MVEWVRVLGAAVSLQERTWYVLEMSERRRVESEREVVTTGVFV